MPSAGGGRARAEGTALILEALVAAAAVGPVYRGRTEEGRPLKLFASSGIVDEVRGSVREYECAEFGDVGPVRFEIPTHAPIDRRGRFSFVVGDRSERVGVAGYVRRGGAIVTGRVRVAGTIATGQRCASPTVRFRLERPDERRRRPTLAVARAWHSPAP